MEADQYRVIITGELIDGFDLDEVVARLATLFKQPSDTVARLFGQQPLPLNTPLSAAMAERVRLQLHGIGAHTRLEPVTKSRLSLLPLHDEEKAEAKAGFSCPICGIDQIPGDTCSDCGAVFTQLRGSVITPAKVRAAAGRDESLDEALFVGSNSERYLEQFGKFRRGSRSTLAVTWHWPALFVPFYWAVYRKMWRWSLLILLSGVLWPVSNLLWAMTANYLYFGHVNKRLVQVRKQSRGRDVGEVDTRIARAGGTSRFALLVAIAISLFIAYQAVIAVHGLFQETLAEVQAKTNNDRLPQQSLNSAEGAATVLNMNVVAIAIRLAAADPSKKLDPSMDIEELGDMLNIPQKSLKDGWGREILLRIGDDSFSLASAGPDGDFYTGDELEIERKLR